MDTATLKGAYERACSAHDAALTRLGKAASGSDEAWAAAKAFADEAKEAAEAAKAEYETARNGGGRFSVVEPDMYTKDSGAFLTDLYYSQLKNDPVAAERIGRHQAYEIEKYAVATGTLGGIIPPQYLVDLYAKAQRFGRVFADQCRSEDLPDVGMSVIIPRLTAGTSAAVQASESATVSTQDPTETDLTINVRTVAGYSPVSRQTLERASYSEAILFEDLIARYHAALDTQVINGTGSAGQHLGVLNVTGVSTATISTWSAANAWAAIVGETGVIAAINQWSATVGANANKIFMHPRRWGAFMGLLDSQNRPLVVPAVGAGAAFNAMGTGHAEGYGGPVGALGGLPVYTDANIPTNLGAGTNQDDIIVIASPAVILWEDNNAPVTLAFEQQAGTALQVQLVCYGYSAFTAGRYPAASGVVSGAGLT